MTRYRYTLLSFGSVDESVDKTGFENREIRIMLKITCLYNRYSADVTLLH